MNTPPAPPCPPGFLSFVRPAVRDRVEHLWRKRPGDLHAWVCHRLPELFPPEAAGTVPAFGEEETCHRVGGGAIISMPYRVAAETLGFGEGLLIVAADGSRFIAESEAGLHAPAVRYGGSQ